MADEATPTATSETIPANDAPVVETALGAAEATPAETDGSQTEGAQPENAEAEATPVVPEAYELKGSEGVDLDPAALELATPVFKELGLTNEAAQKLMPVAEQFAKSITDRHNATILQGVTEQRAAWLNEAKADEEIGGANWDGTLVTAAKALDGLGFVKGSPFRVLLDESGLGNHPEMIRAFAKVGKAISEDSDFPRGGAAPAPKLSREEILYPSMTKKD